MGMSATQMAWLSAFQQGAGVVTSALGASSSADMTRANYEAQSAISDANARIAELGAQSVLAQGNRDVAALTLRAGQLKSSQRAALAANGVDLGYGNAAELQASTDIMKNIDIGTIQSNAIRTAWGYRARAANERGQGKVAGAAASSVSPSSAFASSLLTGAGKVAQSWYQLTKTGAVGGTKQADDPLYDFGTNKGWW